LAAAALAWPVVLAASLGHAQRTPSGLALLGDRTPEGVTEITAASDPLQAELAMELGYGLMSTEGGSVHVLTPTVAARWAPDRALILGVDWPWSLAMVRTDGGAATRYDVRSGNPTVSAMLARALDRAYYALGIEVSVPLAPRGAGIRVTGSEANAQHAAAAAAGVAPSDDLAGSLNLAAAARSTGLTRVHRYTRDQVTLVAPLRLEIESDGLIMGAELRLPVAIATSETQGDDFFPSIAFMLAVQAPPFVWGVRPQMVWLLTENGAWDDEAQFSLVPFVQFEAPRRGFAYAQALVNLDEPLGIFGGGERAWGLTAGAGLRW
jgi:hypothetical protein